MAKPARAITNAIGVIGTAAVVMLAALPVLALVLLGASSSLSGWTHLVSFVLPRALSDTIWLLLAVALGTLVLGTGLAWLTTLCRFPGRAFFAWALVLPLAVPGYIAAYSFVELLEFGGPVQASLRALFASQPGTHMLPDIRSVGGAAFVFSLVLYPYVYLAARLAFATSSASAIETARSLGASPMETFARVAIPIARPALVAGVALALMEVMNDIGAVEILGVRTLGFAVFQTWLNRDDLGGAVQLALLTLLVVAVLIACERWSRRSRRVSLTDRTRPPAMLDVRPLAKMGAFLACAITLLLSLAAPLSILVQYASRRFAFGVEASLISAIGNSVLVASLTALIAVALVYGLLQYARLRSSDATRSLARNAGRVLTLGYAVPGTVLAIGLLIPLAAFDNAFDEFLRASYGVSSGLLISGSLVIVAYACVLRYSAVAFGTIDAAFERMTFSMDMAARSLGRRSGEVARHIHAPILKPALSIAFLLVFVDTMKELPATLLLRPFGFETLATLVYTRASQSALEDGALAALVIVLVGLVPVFLLSRLGFPVHARRNG